MKKLIVLSALALVLSTLPAAAQSLTAFNDSFGDHIYYQSFTNSSAGLADMFQLWPAGTMNIDMTQLPVSSTSGNPGPLASMGGAIQDLASFSNARGQHLYYADQNNHLRHLLVFWNGTKNVITNEDLTVTTGIAFANGPLTAFSNARGEHLYTTSADGHIQHLFWNGSTETGEDLWVNSVNPLACNPSGTGTENALAGVSDGSTELVYYIGPGGHVCEFAWYNGAEWNYDLTAMSGATPAGDYQITAFADTNGQHEFYVGANQHVYWLNLSRSGAWTKADLTQKFGGTPANWSSGEQGVGNSLVGFSNGSVATNNVFGEQVFYVDTNQHVSQINLTTMKQLDLTATAGGPAVTQNSWCGAPLAGIRYDPVSTQLYSQDVYYVGADQHVWRLSLFNSALNKKPTWRSYDLTNHDGGVPVARCLLPIG